MNRRELVKAVAAQCDMEVRQVDETLRGFTDVVTAVVAKGEPVAISGFCKFAKVERPARMGRNPATGEAIKIKASKKARITALKAFKESVMSPSQAPKLQRGVWPPAPAAAAKPASRAAAKPASRAAAKPASRAAAKSRPAAKRATATASRGRAAAAKPAARSTAARRPAARSTARSTSARRTTATRRK